MKKKIKNLNGKSKKKKPAEDERIYQVRSVFEPSPGDEKPEKTLFPEIKEMEKNVKVEVIVDNLKDSKYYNQPLTITRRGEEIQVVQKLLQKGDILVTKATDPSWTPLFSSAAAIVIEIGGPLTHGSVVAKELGIPCIVGVPGLTEKIQTGMTIRMDGSTGVIEIV